MPSAGVPDSAQRALAAGCDMLPVCNDRAAVETLLAGLRDEPQPLRQVRLVRLHGRPAPPFTELRQARRWRDGASSAAHSLDVPELRLDA